VRHLNKLLHPDPVMPYCVFAELVSQTVCLRLDSCWLEILYKPEGYKGYKKKAFSQEVRLLACL